MALFIWGHNSSQQLGLNVADKEVVEMHRVEGLRHEVIVGFSAGAQHSLALNELGQVFAWGRGREGQLGLGPDSGVTSAVPSPRRVGGALAGQWVTTISCGDSHSLALTQSGKVFWWGLLPVAQQLDDEQTRALDASDRATVELAGLSNEAVRPAHPLDELRRHRTDRTMARLVRESTHVYEDAGVVDGSTVKVQTVRVPWRTPRVVTGPLAREIVTHIAAGCAHSLATTTAGAVYSCGYNDNGQLGLGSRRHAAEFQRIAALDGYVMEHIACGQQHSLACSKASASLTDPAPSARTGVCFSWGLGVLGQLGTGKSLSWLPEAVPLARPAVSVAAGSHHSVAVTDDGKVYTWGHSEYGQHGAGETFDDLQHHNHYVFPRLQQALTSDRRLDVVRTWCSSHSTFALTRDGLVFSWGWNAFGVLGNGKYQPSVHPQRVRGLLNDTLAVAIGAGSNHCAVAVRPRGAHYSLRYDRVLARGDFADLVLLVGGQTRERLLAHRVVVSARSRYMDGLVRVLASVQQARDKDARLELDQFHDVDTYVVRAYLTFLYTHRFTGAQHKRKAVQEFASRVCCDALVDMCLDPWRQEHAASRSSFCRHSRQVEAEAHQFGLALKQMVLSDTLADVVFLWPSTDGATCTRVPAHKAVLAQVAYFRTMLMGGFREGNAAVHDATRRTSHEIPLHYMHRDGVSLQTFQQLLVWIYTGCFDLLPASPEPHDLMDLYVGASLVGLPVLASRCELQLMELLPQLDVASLQVCEEFAERYDARRLYTTSHQVSRTLRETKSSSGKD